MNGTVLNVVDGSGVLLDEQGNRYFFGQGDVKSGVVRNGSKVNFIVEGDQAKEIYIMSGGNPLDSLSQSATNLTGGSEVKTAAYIAAAGAFLSLFGLVSSLLAFMGFGLELYGVYRLAVYKGEMDFFWYKLKAVVAGLIATLIFASALESYLMFGFTFGAVTHFGLSALISLFFALVATVYATYTMFKALRGIAYAYNANLFYIAAWVFLVALLSPIVLLTLHTNLDGFLMAIYSVLLIFAYVSIQDIAPTKATVVENSQPIKKEETIICTKCNSANLQTAKFCANCGELLVKEVAIETKCSICGKVYTDGSKFCEEDGGQIV